MAKKGIVSLVAAAVISLFSGCYVSQAPYAYVRIDTPQPESHIVIVQTPQAAPIQVGGYQPFYYNCIGYAASAADSMNPNGKRVEACTCYDQVDPVTGQPNPQSGYRCYRTQQ